MGCHCDASGELDRVKFSVRIRNAFRVESLARPSRAVSLSALRRPNVLDMPVRVAQIVQSSWSLLLCHSHFYACCATRVPGLPPGPYPLVRPNAIKRMSNASSSQPLSGHMKARSLASSLLLRVQPWLSELDRAQTASVFHVT